MASASSSNDTPLPQMMSPDGLSSLARRLRDHADGIRNPAAKAGMGADMTAAAVVIDEVVQLLADVHAGEEADALKRLSNLIGSKVMIDLSRDEATALAEFVKRLTFEDCAKFAATTVTYHDVSEADTIWTGVLSLQRGLAEAGFAPR